MIQMDYDIIIMWCKLNLAVWCGSCENEITAQCVCAFSPLLSMHAVICYCSAHIFIDKYDPFI